MPTALKIQEHNRLDHEGNPAGGHSLALGVVVAWQDGPLGRPPARVEPNGCFVETVIEIAKRRIEFYQTTRFRSDYNAEAIMHLENALRCLSERSAAREARSVEGTHTP